MLAIRMQRTGRKGHAMFRVVVQESRYTPSSGKVVAALGSYDPHAKTAILDKEKAVFYLGNGAQPSERVARLLKKEGVKLPEWVKLPADKKREVRNPDKRRSTQPPAPKEEAAPPEAPAEEAAAPAGSEEKPAEAEVSEPEAETEADTPAEPETAAEPSADEAADDDKPAA